MKPLILALGLLLVPLAASAQNIETVKATGRAQIGDPDARTVALDEAFRKAVRQVTQSLLPARLSAKQREALNRDIYRRSRRYVVSFNVLATRQGETESELVVSVRVNRAQLVDTLGKMGISKTSQSAGPAPAGAAGMRPPVVVIAQWSGTGGARERSRVDRMAASAVGELGFEIKPTGQVPASSSAGSKLPLTDSEAAQVAGAAQAGGGFVAGIQSRPDGTVRATQLTGAVATARVRVVDSQGKLIADSSGSAAGFGADAEAAETMAGTEALRRALAKLRRRLSSHWPAAGKAASQGVTVSLTGVRSHGVLRAIERHLSASRAKVRIVRRRMSQGLVQLVVDSTLSAKRLAAIVRSAPVSSASIRAREKDGQVQVRVRDFSGGGS